MSRLSEMIARLCPNGVEYRKLGEVVEILRGKRLTKNMLSSDSPYPVYHGGLEPLGYYSESNRDGDTVMIINVGASAGTVGYCSEKFWSSDGCFCLAKSKQTIGRYLYYVLQSKEIELKSKVRVAGIPTLDSQVVANITIPLPPLEIQREVVEILDNFAQLTAELTAELAKRKKQYEHYRDMLLNFEGGGINDSYGVESCEFRVEWKRLGEIIESGVINMTRGGYITKKEAKPGEIPVILGGQEPAYFINRFNHEGKAIVISRSGASAGFVSYWNEPIFVTDGFAFDCDESRLNTRYLFHWMKNNQARLNGMKKGGGVPHITGENLKSLELPLPPLAEQKRIVEILDRFDSLCNSLTEGLPAEIALRKKQYEYYRDKLLSFKEAG